MVRAFKVVFVIACVYAAVAMGQFGDSGRGTLKKPIIDSRMTKSEVFNGLDARCPEDIRKAQRIVEVKYYSFDGKVHKGQIVVHRELVSDVKTIFKLILKERFPINSVIPISHPAFRKDGRWDDDLSMLANNSSGFNYREKTGGGSLSNHAYGRAIDINTVQNPYIKGNLTLPPNGSYNPQTPGTLTPEHPIVKKFIELGWAWGGNWDSPKDYQHFEKALRVK